MAEAVYDFETKLRTEEFTSPTAAGVTAANVTLGKPIFDDDTSTLDFLSDLSTDTPAYSASSYNSTTRLFTTSGLTANTTRVLTISYDVNALEGFDAIVLIVDRWPFIWLLLVIIFPLVGIGAIFTGRGD